ncbi:MAG: peptidoglycan DD-metalloendopeptidase family protein [bacterium]
MNLNNYFNKAGKGILFIAILGFALSFGQEAFAEDVEDFIEELQDEISDRKSQMDLLNGQMDEYQKKVNAYSREAASLRNDLSMIENQIKLAEIDVAITQADIESQELEVQVLEEKIRREENAIIEQRKMLEGMLFELNLSDKLGLVEVLFGADDFGELFDEIEQLESLNADLNTALEATKLSRQLLEENRAEEEERLSDLEDLEAQLEQKLAGLEQQSGAKDILLTITKDSEIEYRVLMSELRQEQQYITSQIAKLQADIERRLAESDEVGDASVLTLPVVGGIITATFHDPTYPFRHLFEHSGLDTAVPTGTPIKAAAPGIVAWARTGSSYGNYVMVIHSGGVATLYAHLSSFSVSADQFVSRGQVIGYSGNTGFSTGPHLHFEVRINGIPVNPQAYVVGY